MEQPRQGVDGVHGGVETIAEFIDARRYLVTAAVVHQRPLYGVEHVLSIAGPAEAFGDRTEVANEELLKVADAGFVVLAVPALLGDLYADFFGIAFESLNRAEIAAVELPPLGPECAKNSTRGANEMLVRGSHYALVYTSCLLYL